MQTIKEQVEAIIKNELPNFWSEVSERPNVFGKGTYLAIKIACANYLINGVADQRAQAVSLSLDLSTMELDTQVFGGCGGGRIMRQPNVNDPQERFLAMKGVKVPFKKPKKELANVLAAIQRFCRNYKQTLIENRPVLMYQQLVNYDEILNS